MRDGTSALRALRFAVALLVGLIAVVAAVALALMLSGDCSAAVGLCFADWLTGSVLLVIALIGGASGWVLGGRMIEAAIRWRRGRGASVEPSGHGSEGIP
jgi:hypothetical protein